MNYWKILEELHAELQRIDRAIDVLQGMNIGLPRRGRKSMNAAERRLVSERMRAYWARRRNGATGRAEASG